MNEISNELIRQLEDKAIQIRKDICVTTSKIGYSHLGGSMSMTDIAVALYYDFLNFDPKDPKNPKRDRFVLSKGHCAMCLYNIFVDLGMYTKEELWSEYNQVGGRFGMHPNYRYLKGFEASTGSLGHGLSLALGMALSARMDKAAHRVICLTGDGELDEGSNWEAIMAAAHYHMGNFVLIVDKNHLQINGTTTEIMNIDPLDEKLRAFGWDVVVINGNNMRQVVTALHNLPAPEPVAPKKPIAIIANTIKGKGIAHLEDTLDSHLNVMFGDLLEKSLSSIEAMRNERS